MKDTLGKTYLGAVDTKDKDAILSGIIRAYSTSSAEGLPAPVQYSYLPLLELSYHPC